MYCGNRNTVTNQIGPEVEGIHTVIVTARCNGRQADMVLEQLTLDGKKLFISRPTSIHLLVALQDREDKDMGFSVLLTIGHAYCVQEWKLLCKGMMVVKCSACRVVLLTTVRVSVRTNNESPAPSLVRSIWEHVWFNFVCFVYFNKLIKGATRGRPRHMCRPRRLPRSPVPSWTAPLFFFLHVPLTASGPRCSCTGCTVDIYATAD